MSERKELLEQWLVSELKKLQGMAPGEERSKRIEELQQLYKIKLEEEGMEAASEEKMKLTKIQSFERFVSLGVQAGISVISLLAYGHWFRQGLQLETTNTVGSTFFRNLVGKMNFRK